MYHSTDRAFVARDILYVPFHRQGLCYTSCGLLAGTKKSSVGLPTGIDPVTLLYHRATSSFSECREVIQNTNNIC